MRLITLLSIGLVFLFVGFPALAEDERDYLLVAHRGVVTDTLTENSLASLEETIRRGYTHIEVDLRVTKDGQAVCLHYSSLRRTTSIRKHIHEVTLAELRELVSKEVVPSFATFAKRCAGRIELMPDIKKVPEELKGAFYASLNATMTKYDLLDEALFIGDKSVANHFKGRARVSWHKPVAGMTFEGDEAADPGRYYFVFAHAVDFTAESIRAYQERGLQVVVSINTFHYRKAESMERGLHDVKTMLEWGADGVQIDSVYEPALPQGLYIAHVLEDEYDIVYEEIERGDNFSTVQVTLKKGTSVGSSMFLARCSYDVANIRRFDYFILGNEWSEEDDR